METESVASNGGRNGPSDAPHGGRDGPDGGGQP